MLLGTSKLDLQLQIPFGIVLEIAQILSYYLPNFGSTALPWMKCSVIYTYYIN